MEEIGKLCEIEAEIKFEWRIEDFLQLSEGTDVRYESGTFHFSGASWQIWIFPNGQTEKKTVGWIGLYLVRLSAGLPLTIHYSFILKDISEYADRYVYKKVFDKKNHAWGLKFFISRSALLEKMSTLIPSDILTIVCTVKNSEPTNTHGSLFHRYQELSDHFKELYTKAEKTDFTIKIGEKNISAHRTVLATRSPYFAAMLSHDTIEAQTGEVTITDIESCTIDTMLKYMYTGDVDELTTENALPLCVAADKYDVKGLKDMCLKFIANSLSMEWVIDVIKFAEIHQEDELSRRAENYFRENADEILETESWKTLQKENPDFGCQLLSSLVKEIFPKIKSLKKLNE